MTKAIALAALVILTASAQKKPEVVSQTVWSPKATKLPGWTGPHKPHTKLAEVLAAHKGQANWSHLVVDDEHLNAQYIQMAPGASTRRRMHPDTREWWVIQAGQIRFTIDGQEPFVAKKGYLVQVPYRTFSKMETVGTEPSVRFEVNIAKAKVEATTLGLMQLRTQEADQQPDKQVMAQQRLALEKTFAEQQLATAMTAMEQSRIEAIRKQVYIERITQPVKPDYAVLPERVKGIMTTLVLSLVFWGILMLLIAGVKEHHV